MSLMEMKAADEKSHVATFGIDHASGAVSIMFKNSAFRYDHLGVSAEDIEAFETAESKGSAYAKFIKKYPSQRIDTAAEDVDA